MSGMYPIAEIFFSVQGEGGESGTPMVFVRLAGCTVGKPYTEEHKKTNGLAIFQNECTIYDGRKFPCDTDYRKKQMMTAGQMLEAIKFEHLDCRHVSITGGEPLMHDLGPLLTYLISEGYSLHLETSGTIPLTANVLDALKLFDYLVVSPKAPFIDAYVRHADEIRILVDQEFDWNKLPLSITNYSSKLWISPVNDLVSIDKSNAAKCMEIVAAHPEVRISLQIHKLLGVR